jgi:hypothetical protein
VKDLSIGKRLKTYRELTRGAGASRHVGNWTAFAAATGSALAMASSASASIIYTHPSSPVTASIEGLSFLPPNHPGLNSRNSAAFAAGPGNFRIFVSQSVQSSFNGSPGFNGTTRGEAGLLGLDGAEPTEDNVSAGGTHLVPVEAGGDNGWIRLEVFDGPNGLPDKIEAIDWAYNNVPGGSITPGQESGGGSGGSSTPEPSTAAMALLAAGWTGVLALRRRHAEGASGK